MKSLFVRLPRICVAVFFVIVLVQSSKFTFFVLGNERVADSERVDFFAAINSGQIDVTLTQNNSLNGHVTIKNKTKKTLLLQLPGTFAGVPYNAQEGALPATDPPATRPSTNANSSTTGTTNNNNQNQAVGGAYGGYGGGGYGGYGGGGYFSLPPEKVVRHNIKTVCLEYGKKEPRSSIKYRMQPLETITDKPEVGVLCSLISSGAVDQWSAQAAVWHYNNNLAWNEIATKRVKPRIDSMYSVPLFSPQQISYAINLCQQVESIVAREKLTPNKPKPKTQIFKSTENYESIVNDVIRN